MKLKIPFLLLIACFSVLNANALSFGLDYMDEFHEHNGLYFSLSPGIDFLNISAKNQDFEYTLKGQGSMLDFQMGYALRKNIVAYVSLIYIDTYQPEITINGERADSIGNSMGQLITGLGATYFSQKNFYLSGMIGWGNASTVNEEQNDIIKSDMGLTYQFKVGKEIYDNGQWTLGLGLSYCSSVFSYKTNYAGTEKIFTNNYTATLYISFN